VRRVALLGGHPLPADAPPARTIAGAGGPSSARAAADDTSLPGWLPFAVFAAVFLLAWLGYELRMRAPGRPHRPAVN
jgi:type VI protein secretion system component VasF